MYYEVISLGELYAALKLFATSKPAGFGYLCDVSIVEQKSDETGAVYSIRPGSLSWETEQESLHFQMSITARGSALDISMGELDSQCTLKNTPDKKYSVVVPAEFLRTTGTRTGLQKL